MEISFFFPAYNDEATVAPLARAADEVLSGLCRSHEIIIVDDASPDASGRIADELAAENPRIRVIHHPENRGYGQVLWSAIQAARYEWLAFTDGDMQYDVGELPRLVAAAGEGVGLVAGYKTSRAEGWQRRLTSSLYNLSLRLLLDYPLRDADCAFKLMHRSLFAGFTPSLPYKEAFILVEAVCRARRRGLTIAQVPVSHRPRPHGQSQCYSFRTARRLAYYTLRGALWGRLLGGWR